MLDKIFQAILRFIVLIPSIYFQIKQSRVPGSIVRFGTMSQYSYINK